MSNEEMLEKLRQIEEQARRTLSELPLRLAKDRLKLIIGLARYMHTDIEMGLRGSSEPDTAFKPAPRH